MSHSPLLPPAPGAGDAQDLTLAILARTSGSPCARVEDLACAFVDGKLAGPQAQLLQGHLEHCEGCAALLAALAQTTALLPRLAEADPGPWFTARVLRATVHAPRAEGFGRGFDGRSLWWRLLHRPRIALEAATMGAAVGMMGLALPLPSGATPQALAHLLSPEPLVAPLQAPAQRVLGQLGQTVQAQRRTVANFRKGLGLEQTAPVAKTTPGSLWQRSSLRIRGWLRSLRAPAPEKTSSPANP